MYKKKTLISTCPEQAKEYINGRNFCSTGKLKHHIFLYSNFLQAFEGDFHYRITDGTNVLICGKNFEIYRTIKEAKDAGMEIITEAEFIAKTGLKAKIVKIETSATPPIISREPAMEAYLRFKVTGIHYLEDEKGKKTVKALKPGDKLILERDPDNIYDDWAMEVYAEPYTFIGYVESGMSKNEKLCKLKKCGLVCRCEVDDVILSEGKTPIVYAKAFYLEE